MKKNSKIIIAVVVVVALIAIFAGVYMGTRPAASEGAKTITVEVIHKDKSAKTFTYHTDEEYLGAVLVAEGLIEGTDSEWGLYVTTVDGETADFAEDGSWWGLYQDGEMTPTGVDTTPIADGNSFQWIYTVG